MPELFLVHGDPVSRPAVWHVTDPRQLTADRADVTWLDPRRMGDPPELPEAVRKAMKDCAIKTWYLIHSGGKQYIYYNGFAWSFGYEPVLNNGKWTVDILRFQKKDSGYLLLSLPEGSPVGVTCDGEAVKLTEIQ